MSYNEVVMLALGMEVLRVAAYGPQAAFGSWSERRRLCCLAKRASHCWSRPHPQ
jgi:hypothetical protein